MISKDRSAFVFHRSWVIALSEFPVELQGEVFRAACEYAFTGKTQELSPLASIAFSFIKNDLENDGLECPNSTDYE